MNKSVIIGGSVAFLLIMAFGVYFFARGGKPDGLNSSRNKLQADLALAQDKLASQKEKLSSMLADIKQSFSLAITVQDQIRQATDI
ncbi:hypothetical protein K2P96_00920, partial [Patescibacteria group bacterium]|nr:hypothetical protein [Patescibacteria group bacterium]